MRVIITGALGFIGSALLRRVLSDKRVISVLNIDCLTYAGSEANVTECVADPRYSWNRTNLRSKKAIGCVVSDFAPTHILHLAAESHVDRSIDDPDAFMLTNVMGTFHLLAAARSIQGVRFHHVSTDEVFGSIAAPAMFTESSAYSPNSPYSASKAASDHIVRAYATTYGLSTTISNGSNTYGPRQNSEKFIPTVIRSCLSKSPIPLYGDGLNVRDWLHVDDHADAIWQVATRAKSGSTYLVGGSEERTNIEVATIICGLFDELRPWKGHSHASLITPVRDRPGHDRRYSVSADAIRLDLGWRTTYTLEDGLRELIKQSIFTK